VIDFVRKNGTIKVFVITERESPRISKNIAVVVSAVWLVERLLRPVRAQVDVKLPEYRR
jgi:hypothetical protein